MDPSHPLTPPWRQSRSTLRTSVDAVRMRINHDRTSSRDDRKGCSGPICLAGISAHSLLSSLGRRNRSASPDPCQGNTEAANHGPQRQNKISNSDGRINQPHGSRLRINSPVAPFPLGQMRQGLRFDDVRSQRRIRPAGAARRRHALDLHNKRVAGLTPSTKKGPVTGLGLGARSMFAWSRPPASSVEATTASPSDTRNAGSRVPSTL
jgi:hypothetical protein